MQGQTERKKKIDETKNFWHQINVYIIHNLSSNKIQHSTKEQIKPLKMYKLYEKTELRERRESLTIQEPCKMSFQTG